MNSRRVLAAAALIVTSSLYAAADEVLPFVEDDYERALAEARARKVPIFVETWAPW
jgi:hypothetical protein